MNKLSILADHGDGSGNSIECSRPIETGIAVTFRGRNNRIIVAEGARIAKLQAVFDCDNGTLIIGPSNKSPFSMNVRIGQDATVRTGADLTTTSVAVVSAVEGAAVTFGDDVMIASSNQFRTDDGHPIFDVATGRRVNPARDVVIGNHVWFGGQAVALGGARVGDGSVIGFRSVVTGTIPNNVIAVGSPARVVRRDVAWERPHLSFTSPPYKPDASSVTRSEEYWNLTAEDVPIFEELSGWHDHH
ncbi:acyltransferase [Paenarthrobacter sp. NPDC018779]|uniref:acyltransferase n=1 Tax=Paenarthrobacter sp. NPDC018779 TaxID=3364375 RepID=UPI0037C6219A